MSSHHLAANALADRATNGSQLHIDRRTDGIPQPSSQSFRGTGGKSCSSTMVGSNCGSGPKPVDMGTGIGDLAGAKGDKGQGLWVDHQRCFGALNARTGNHAVRKPLIPSASRLIAKVMSKVSNITGEFEPVMPAVMNSIRRKSRGRSSPRWPEPTQRLKMSARR